MSSPCVLCKSGAHHQRVGIVPLFPSSIIVFHSPNGRDPIHQDKTGRLYLDNGTEFVIEEKYINDTPPKITRRKFINPADYMQAD